MEVELNMLNNTPNNTPNDLYIKDTLLNNTQHEIISVKNQMSSKVGRDKVLSIVICRECEYSLVDLIINPVVIFELNGTDLEFDYARIFRSIWIGIGGTQIDKLNQNQIMLYLAKYNLKVVCNEQKVFFPIPIQCVLGGLFSSKCMTHDIRFTFDFSNSPIIDCIDNMSLQTDFVMCKTKPDYAKICDAGIKYYTKNNIAKKNNAQDYFFQKYENNGYLSLIYQNQTEICDNLLSGGDNIKIKLGFNHEVKKIYLYMEDKNTKVIYKGKGFEHLEFIANGYIALEMNWEKMVLESKMNSNLPNGIYQIDWENKCDEIYKGVSLSRIDSLILMLSEICVPSSNVSLVICADNINYLLYSDNMSGVAFSN